jgi:hypothetical protein
MLRIRGEIPVIYWHDHHWLGAAPLPELSTPLGSYFILHTSYFILVAIVKSMYRISGVQISSCSLAEKDAGSVQCRKGGQIPGWLE